ncbi:MAG: hypothetical protein FWB74_10475, partial [Defluviitaleaceae bacterium]|nr:hypothetical protein [Defluviitaleaceae bacterium]
MAVDKKAAKAAKKAAKAQGQGTKKKSKVGLIIALALVGVVGAFVLLTAFNVFGLRDDIVMPFLRNVPLIGRFIPAAEGADDYDPAATALRTEQELRLHIEELERQMAELEAETSEAMAGLADLFGHLAENEIELMRLRALEEAFAQFMAEREQFEREVIENNPDAYINWFETMNPDRAEEIYQELIADMVAGYGREHYLNMWAEMHPASVAGAI